MGLALVLVGRRLTLKFTNKSIYGTKSVKQMYDAFGIKKALVGIFTLLCAAVLLQTTQKGRSVVLLIGAASMSAQGQWNIGGHPYGVAARYLCSGARA